MEQTVVGTQTSSSLFSHREREILQAIAGTVIPPGRILPGAGNSRSVDRIIALLSSLPPGVLRSFRALLWTIETTAVARYLKPFTKLTEERQNTFLRSWIRGNIARRAAIRLLTLPLKVAHFNDPALFEEIGCIWKPEAASRETSRWRSQIINADGLESTFGSTDDLEVEVIVVGTGAGGAVVAKELAARGYAVLMVEEGSYYDRKDFTTMDRLEVGRKMYRGGGLLTTVGNTTIPVVVGKSVGGTTTLNSGTCFRTPDKVLNAWHTEHGLRDFSPEHMAPFFESVEDVLQVEEASWEYLGGVAEVVRDGCEALGYSHKPLKRNAPDCDGQGVCCFGCPTDAKRSTNVSYVPLALQHSALCLTEAKVTRIIVEDGRATGVEATCEVDGGASTRTIRIRAPYTVICAGSVYSPLLLLENDLCNRWDQVGRHLSIHPASGMNAVFERPIEGWRGIPQGYSIDEFTDEGILFEGAFVPMEMATLSMRLIGREFMEAMEAFNRMAIFGYMINDTSRGRVHRGPQGRPVLTYHMNNTDMHAIQRAATILAEVFFAADAHVLYTPITGHEILRDRLDVQRLSEAKLHAWDVEMSAYHPLGTCRMGVDPRTSVVDSFHETHEISNLFIVDGSSVPSSLGVNPQITIMALATRFASLFDERYRKRIL
jgi:choline dehydrogenase-like flavoprotein